MLKNHYKKFNFSPWFNRIKIHYKTIEKRKSTKSGVAKSLSKILGVEKSKRINACISTNIEIIVELVLM